MNIFVNKKEQRLRAGWRILVQFIMMFLISGLVLFGTQYLWRSSLSLAVAFPSFVGILISVWLAARFLDKRPFFDFGLKFNSQWGIEFIIGSAIGTIAMGSIFLVEWSENWIAIQGFGWQHTQGMSFGWTLATAFLAMLMVGFHEELFSRGYQVLNLTEGLSYPRLGSSGPVIIAVLTTSSLFGLMHLGNPNASVISTFNIVLAGIALAIPYILTGSLALSIGIHFSWNFMQGGICGFPVSGMNFQASVVKISQRGTNLWTGGAFGPEAGLMGIMGITIIIVLSYVYIKVTREKVSIAEPLTADYRSTTKSDEHKP